MLSFLTEPNYPKAAIGLERERITALSLNREGRAFGIRQASSVELPTGLLNPSFLELNISSSNEFAAYLEEAVSSAGLLKQKDWSVSLPSNAARSAILTIESGASGKNESEEILDWKAEQTFGAPAVELRMTRHKIPADAEGRTRYFASAVKLSVIDEYESVFERFGWNAGLILPRAVCESKWITADSERADSMLISSQSDGFSAILMRSGEPAVIRSVTCAPAELDDEIYRLLMFYNDRFGADSRDKLLERILLIGKGLIPGKIREISSEAMGRTLQVLRPEEVGLNMPASSLNFDDVAAPAGLAALGWR